MLLLHLLALTAAAQSAQSSLADTLWPNLEPKDRAVLYAPLVWGADPHAVANRPTNLYADKYNATFRRDVRVLHELHATTLVLEPAPAIDNSYHQGLYNATNFIAAQSDVQCHSSTLGPRRSF